MEPLLSTEGVKRRPLLSPLLHPESLFNFTTTTQVTTTTTRNHHHHQQQHHHNNCLQTSCHHRILPFISSSVQPKKSISHLPSFLTTMTILLLLGVTFLSSIVTASQSSIRLDGSNNGYTGIVVSFSPNIQISQRETMVREMQAILERTSDLLYTATDRRAFLKEVTFLIPKSWSVTQWTTIKGMKKTRTLSIKDADFVLKGSADAFLDAPMTVQLGGCGRPGLQVELSTKFMTSTTSSSSSTGFGGSSITDLHPSSSSLPFLRLEDKAKIILANWAKYRYGVFDEHGFVGDKQYPLYWTTPGMEGQASFDDGHNFLHANLHHHIRHSSSSLGSGYERITSCVASRDGTILPTIKTVNRTGTNNHCILKTNPMTGLPEEGNDCIPFPDVHENGEAVSSIMSHPTLSNVGFFCDSTTHNRESPNKQNNLCEGASVMEVIERHSDFLGVRKRDITPEERRPVFKYVQEEDPRITFIIDTDRTSSEKNLIKNALTRFKNSLEPQSMLLTLDMKDSRQVHLSDRATPYWSVKNDFTPTVWGRVKENPVDPICLKCVMDVFENSLTGLKNPSDLTSDLIIITEGNIIDSELEIETIARTLVTRGINLRIVVFPYTRESNIEGLKRLVSQVRGSSIHLIPRTTSGLDGENGHRVTTSLREDLSPISLQLKLYDTFDSFLSTNQNVQIARRLFLASGPAILPRMIDFTFDLDSSLISSNMELVAQFFSSAEKEDFDGPFYSLVSESTLSGSGSGPTTTIYTYTTKSREYRSAEKAFVIPLNSVSPGKWKLSFHDYNNHSFIGVAYVRVSGKNRHPIQGQCVIQPLFIEGDRITPPSVHLVLTKDHSLVQEAVVDVSVVDDQGSVIARELPLLDDGLASPDATGGDGIYSRFLLESHKKGFYNVQVRVRSKDNNGSGSPSTHTTLHTGSTDVSGVECCGSTVPKQTRSPSDRSATVHHLERLIDCGWMYLDQDFSPDDYVDRISDLRVEYVEKASRRVAVSFTPPPLTTSTPSAEQQYRLTIRVFPHHDFSSIRESFESRGELLLSYVTSSSDLSTNLPSTLGTAGVSIGGNRDRITHVFNITNYKVEGIYHLAIRVTGLGSLTLHPSSPAAAQTSTGHADRPYMTSNIVTFFLPTDPSLLTTEADGDPLSIYTTRHPNLVGHSLKHLEIWQVVALSALGLILFVILVAASICVCSSAKRKSSSSTSSSTSSNSNDPKNNNNKNKSASGHITSSSSTGNINKSSSVNPLHIQTMAINDGFLTSSHGSLDKVTPSSGHGSSMGQHSHHMYGHHGGSSQYMSVTDPSTGQLIRGEPTHYSTIVTDSVLGNPINPVGHVSADVLLGHYAKVQQARERKEPPPVMKIEEVLPDGSGCSTGSDNPTSRESGSSYEDNTFPVSAGQVSGGDWRYANIGPQTDPYNHHVPYNGAHRAQPAYVHYSQPVYGESGALYTSTTGDVSWDVQQTGYDGHQPIQVHHHTHYRPSSPTSELAYSIDSRTGGYNRRSTTVSQV